MLRSMLSAASAIRNHQTYMDVVANNIANVNTTAFKTGRVTFHELLTQVINSGSAPQGNRGGVNPIQVGLGMALGSIDGVFTQGAMQATGRTTDLAMQGNGFFVYQGSDQQYYSRDGSLDLGLDGSLLNPSTGLRVLGWNADASGKVDTKGILSAVTVPLNQGLAQATQNIHISGNVNAQAISYTTSYLQGSVSGAVTIPATVNGFGVSNLSTGQTELATGQYTVEVSNTSGTFQFRVKDASGALVPVLGSTTGDWQNIPAAGGAFDTGRGMVINFGTTPASWANGTAGVRFDATNVPISNNVTAFDVKATMAGQSELPAGEYYVETRTSPSNQFRILDSTGGPVAYNGNATGDWAAIPASSPFDTGRGLTVSFGAGPIVNTSMNNGAAIAHFSPQHVTTSVQVYDSLGTVHAINLTLNKTGVNGWTWQAVSADTGVTLTPSSPSPISFTSNGQFSTANPATTLQLSFTNGAANQTVALDLAQLTQLAKESDLGVPTQDGYAPGQLTGFSVSAGGEVTGSYANGMRKVVAQLAVANFVNPGGLLREGDNMFAISSNSGAAGVGTAGTGGRGSIMAGYLEAANVDLAQQFTSMITAQRGFQANSRVISASDQMLQDLVNLVR
jgi:flagellar hook protein FlgE